MMILTAAKCITFTSDCRVSRRCRYSCNSAGVRPCEESASVPHRFKTVLPCRVSFHVSVSIMCMPYLLMRARRQQLLQHIGLHAVVDQYFRRCVAVSRLHIVRA